jgi:hypothetical protein
LSFLFEFESHCEPTRSKQRVTLTGAVRGFTVPIRQLLEADPIVFGPDDIQVIVQAFEQVLCVKQLVDRADPLVQLIAELTIQVAGKGERNPSRLCETVLSLMSL